MMTRQRHFKAGLNVKATRKATVSAYTFGTEPLVEFRVLDPGHRKELDATMSLPQAREAVRLMQAAIDAAEAATRHDGPSSQAAGRGPAARDHADEQRA